MKTIETILARRSQKVIEGEIDGATLEAIFRCALTAPDHKRLRPWQFVVCHGQHKAALKEVLLAAKPFDSEIVRQAYIEQLERKLNFAPHIVICLLKINRSGAVPEIEQILSAGASIQNMIVAAESLGFHCFWKTGEWAYNPAVREGLGFDADTVITGFLGLGRSTNPANQSAPVERPKINDHFRSLDELLEPCLAVQ
ncbi:nitroreductase family protein [Chitinimonas lacunae]|uniref:Putative NAD(P)H nitroreductase n=1 Tax=Chitinimonas lacunae TaxID=1963018 RepID=A0ABV8MQ34_9NEIS